MAVSLVPSDSRLAFLRGMLCYSRFNGVQLWFPDSMERARVSVLQLSETLVQLFVVGSVTFSTVITFEQLDALPFSD